MYIKLIDAKQAKELYQFKNIKRKLYRQLYELLMMGASTRNMYSCLHKYNKLNKSHLVGQY